jgi:signal transduction histidine kinase
VRWVRSALGLTLLAGACTAPPGQGPAKTDGYMYADTRRLVRFVEEAAAVIESRGTAAFAEFARDEARWKRGELYLFVYRPDGINVFHGASPELVGHDLSGFRDLLGKPVIEDLAAVTQRPERDASEWTFYLWEEKSDFQPCWKASYARKAVTPDGRTFVVGSGSSRLKVERVWVKARVDQAAELFRRKGKEAAFATLRDPASRFQFLDTYLFVTDEGWHALVDPAYPTRTGRDLGALRDAVGRNILHELAVKLGTADEGWAQYLWRRPGESLPARKALYVKEVVLGGERFFVGSTFALASPIWMRQ